MPDARPWTDDGHVVVVEEVDRDSVPAQVTMHVECTAEKCAGPYVACAECYGSGTVYDEDDDETGCDDCNGTGWDGGKRQCWLTYGDDYAEVADELVSGPQATPGPGRYRLLYRTDGQGEEFTIEARFGPVAVPAGQLSLAPAAGQNQEAADAC
jgi:hypothetical protein